jgi:predicted PurR-regulated permease PerM
VSVIAWCLGRIAVVLGASFLALIIARGLMPITKLLRSARLGPGSSAAISLLLFTTIAAAIVSAATSTVVGQVDSLSGSLDAGARDIEN